MSDTVWSGKFLEVRQDGRWEYAARTGDMAAVVIVAVDAEDHVILIEQDRLPIGGRCLELPAGLIGDDHAGESTEDAARRELEEETGYRAATIAALGEFCSSPGMTSERFTIVRATGLTRTGNGGGVGGEDIAVHRVPLADVAAFVAERRAMSIGIDAKLLLLLGAGML